MEDFSLPPSIKELLANPTPHHKGHPGIKPRACEFQINSKCRFDADLPRILWLARSKNFVGVSSIAGATDLSALADLFNELN